MAWLPRLVPGTSNLTGLRAVRALRPLRTLHYVPGMPLLVRTVLQAIRQLGEHIPQTISTPRDHPTGLPRYHLAPPRDPCDLEAPPLSITRSNTHMLEEAPSAPRSPHSRTQDR